MKKERRMVGARREKGSQNTKENIDEKKHKLIQARCVIKKKNVLLDISSSSGNWKRKKQKFGFFLVFLRGLYGPSILLRLIYSSSLPSWAAFSFS